MLRSFMLLSLAFLQISCFEAQNSSVSSPIGSAITRDTGGGAQGEGEVSLLGTSSGGGGLSDKLALEVLEIAKLSLAQMIKNTPDEAFVNLPHGKSKKWMVEIIKTIETNSDVASERYDRPLKFNYDLEVNRIYATNNYIQTFPYGRLSTRSVSDQLRVIKEVQLDILHELSHFFDIGTSLETDYKSTLWAEYLFEEGIDSRLKCQKSSDEFQNAFVIHVPTGIYISDLSNSVDDSAFFENFYREYVTENMVTVGAQGEFEDHIVLLAIYYLYLKSEVSTGSVKKVV